MGYLSEYNKKNKIQDNTTTSSSGGGYLQQYEAQQAKNPAPTTTNTPTKKPEPVTVQHTQNNFDVGNLLNKVGDAVKSAISHVIPQLNTTPPPPGTDLLKPGVTDKKKLSEPLASNPVANDSAQLNPQVKNDIVTGKTPNLIDTLLKPLTERPQILSPIPQKPNEIQYAPSKLDLLKQAATEEFPQTAQAMKDIFKNPDPKKALTDMWDAIKQPAIEEFKRVMADQQPAKSPADYIGKKISKYTGAVGVLFSPISAAFAGAQDVPVLSPIARMITVPFTLFGEGGAKISGGIIDQLPIDQKSKDALKPAAQEVGSLISQIALGEVAGIGTKKAGETIRKVGVDSFEKLTKDVITTTGSNTVLNLSPADVRKINLGQTGYEADLVKSLGLTGDQWAQAVKEGISIQISPEKVVRIVDKPYWEKVKSLFKVSKTDKIVTTPGGTTTQPGFGGYLQDKNVLTPDQVRAQATGTDLRGTPVGDTLLKTAADAEAQGKNIKIEPSTDRALQTPNGTSFKVSMVDTPTAIDTLTGTTKETVPTGIAGMNQITKYTSASDFADAVYSARPTDQIGKLDPKTIEPRDAIDKQGKTYKDTVVKLKAGRMVEPIEVEKVDGKLITVDGSNRLGAAQDTGKPIPVIYRGQGEIPGLKTIEEVYQTANTKTVANAGMPKELSSIAQEGKHKYSFLRNTERAPKPTGRDQFGQRIEPAGKYMNLVSKEHATSTLDYYKRNGVKNWETGTVEFKKPLIIDTTGKTTKQWKVELSKKYGGKKGKALTQALIKDGYDGIITTADGSPSESIHFDRQISPEIAKDLKNQKILRERALKKMAKDYLNNKKEKFREKDLVTIHNLSESGILKADSMGGLPVPSLAITKADIPFEGFGEISLIGGKHFAEGDVYTSDVYTRRVPQQKFKLTKEAPKLRAELRPYLEKTGEYSHYVEGLEDDSRASLREVMQKAKRNNGFKAMFLKEAKDITVEPVIKEVDYAKRIEQGGAGLDKRSAANSPYLINLLKTGEIKSILDKFNNEWERDPSKVKEAKQFIQKIEEDIKTNTLATTKDKYIADVLTENFHKSMFSDSGEFFLAQVDSFFYKLSDMMRKGKTEIDMAATEDKINNYMKNIPESEYMNWVAEKFAPAFGDSYFYDNAGRKKPYNMNAILEYMTGRVRGQENFFYGAGSVKSRISKKLSGVNEVAQNEGSIVTEEQAKKSHDELQTELMNLLEEIKAASKWRNSEEYGIYDQIGRDISLTGSNISLSRVESGLRRAGVEEPSMELVHKTYDYLKKLQSAPVSYFESKPQRAVKLSEFSGALVPNDTSAKVIDILKKNGLNVVEYNPKIEGDRSAKIQVHFKDELFRFKDDFEKATGVKISNAEEKQIMDLNQKIFGDTDIKIVGQVLANKDALGSYKSGIIQVLEGQKNLKDTFYHEAVHKYLDVFTTRDEQVQLLLEAQKKYGIEDFAQVEEKLAEDFIDYAKSREGFVGKLQLLIDRIIERIRAFLNHVDQIDKLYQDILGGKRPEVKEVKIPRAQIPVGEGELKVSKLEARIKEQLKNIPPDKIDSLGLSTYNELTKEENIAKATEYVLKNPDDALKVLQGEMEAPKGILRNAIYVAMENNAIGNVDLARKLASITSSRLGQEISILTEIDPHSPVKIIRDVVNFREASFQRKNPTRTAAKAKADIVESIKKKVVKPDKYDWENFINSIDTC